MRVSKVVIALIAILMSSACGSPTVTDDKIIDAEKAQLESVDGRWVGVSAPETQNPIRLEFVLRERINGQLIGAGTMKEANAPTAVSISITGAYQRPELLLTFDQMVYEGQQVKGTVDARYTSVAGIITTLQLTGPNYSKSLEVLLQEVR